MRFADCVGFKVLILCVCFLCRYLGRLRKPHSVQVQPPFLRPPLSEAQLEAKVLDNGIQQVQTHYHAVFFYANGHVRQWRSFPKELGLLCYFFCCCAV